MEVYVSDNNRCVMCGVVIPEGMMVCKQCSEKCDCSGAARNDGSDKDLYLASKS